MKKFIKTIKEKNKQLDSFFTKTELHNIEKLIDDLEKEHHEIKTNLQDINYLLDLIEKHPIENAVELPKQEEKGLMKNWLKDIKIPFEKLHLLPPNELTLEDKIFLEKEKRKLEAEKERLEKEHSHIHALLAKAYIYLMDVRNQVCKKIADGHNVAAVAEKILEHFGKKIEGETTYDGGRRTIMRFLEKTFSIDRIQSRQLIDILGKSKVIKFEIDMESIPTFPNYQDFIDFTDLNYVPVLGAWHINA